MAGKHEHAGDAEPRHEEPKAARKARAEEPKGPVTLVRNLTRESVELQIFNGLLRDAVKGEKRHPTPEERATAQAAARKRALEMVP